MFDWNDIRCFLAVARDGSTLAASRTLAINQTTVARRLAALEEALGLRLFERTPTGYRLSPAGTALLPAAEAMALEATGFLRQAEQQKRRISGAIRVTTTDILASMILMPALGDFAMVHPEVEVQAVIDDRALDLLTGEADIAIRVGGPATDQELVVRRLASAHWGLYCSTSYAERRGMPENEIDMLGHPLLGFEGALDRAPIGHWLRARAGNAVFASRSNTLLTHLNAIRAGLGVGALPRIEGDRHPDLSLCVPRIEAAEQAVWLVLRPEARGLKHVRAFVDFLAERIIALRPLFEGRE